MLHKSSSETTLDGIVAKLNSRCNGGGSPRLIVLITSVDFTILLFYARLMERPSARKIKMIAQPGPCPYSSF